MGGVIEMSRSDRPKSDLQQPPPSGGVTAAWLAAAFNMDVAGVRRKLAACPIIGRKTSAALYSLPVAAAYLVKPRVDVAEYLEGLEPKDLPIRLQQSYWDAQLKRQKWEREAGHLWETEDVVDAMAEVFKAIKFAMQLWPDTLERMTGLSEEQREILTREADNLQNEIFQAMRRLAEARSTPSALSRLREVPGEEPEPDLAEDIL